MRHSRPISALALLSSSLVLVCSVPVAAADELDLDALVTARYGIEQINEATTALENGEIQGRAILQFD